ncbi:MAG: hypothetical protein PHQ58_15770 [Rhodoferax sp.]|uniref:hypothetical protein n=1 Tax=Rhodoferax sp. TaxID=50421 RepID=UPI00262531CE|nr:hypothetical protein [Rhodoferax sp.]MDD2881885.1 hypothetical protein [Rhodoferax sp.]
MQIDDDLTRRFQASMEALNARIARLALALCIDLNERAVVDALMAKPQIQAVAEDRRRAGADEPHVRVTSERRQAHQREELRGLLLLRYQMEVTSLTDNGWNVTRDGMKQAEEQLVRQGFKPGADGLGLNDFFDIT